MKILAFCNKDEISVDKSGPTGAFTSGIVSILEDYRITLFFTGRQHAGENLIDLLKRRRSGLDTPIQTCDALSRNMPEELTREAADLKLMREELNELYGKVPEQVERLLDIAYIRTCK